MKASWGFIFVALVFAAGCEDSDEHWQPEPFDGSVRITMECDTAVFLPGDTITVPGYAVVTDRNYAALPGVKVAFSVAPPTLGVILFADSILQDTTNEAGRADFSLRSSGREGDAVVTASVGGVSDSCALHLREWGFADSTINLVVSPLNLWLGEGQPDSAFVVISIRDSVFLGIPNVTPVLVPDSGGRVGVIPPTDSLGRTNAWWWPSCCGIRCIRASHGALTDEECILVDSL